MDPHYIRCSMGTIAVVHFRRAARPNCGSEPTMALRANMTVNAHRIFGAPVCYIKFAVGRSLDKKEISMKKVEKAAIMATLGRHTSGSNQETCCGLNTDSEQTTAAS